MAERNEATERVLNDPENLYLCWRQLDDGTYVALGRLMFTTALFIGVVGHQYARRYCYTALCDAVDAYNTLTTGDDEPTGWIARRPETAEDKAAKALPGYDPSVFWPKRDD